MTSDQQRQFEHTWPVLSVRLHRLLARKKVSPWLAEDLVQETGLRLIRMWPEIDQAKPLWPLTATIALNLFRDEMRRAGGKESIQELPDSPSAENVEERGMARVELRAVGGALAQMPALQRNAILADLSAGTAASPLASSARMLRMRARRRLQHLMDHASVLGVALGVQMRRVMREAELVIGRILPTDAERATAAAISLLAAVSLGVVVGPGSPSHADEPRLDADARIGDGTDGGTSTAGSSVAALAPSRSQTPSRRRGDAVGGGAASSGDAARATENGDQSENGREPNDLPGVTRYSLTLTEGTYVRGAIEVDVFGAGDPDSVRSFSRSPGQFNCTVAPTHTGASCATSEGGSEYTGVRAEYRGEARVAGRRVL